MTTEIKTIREIAKATALDYFNDKEWFSKKLKKVTCKAMVETFLNNYNDENGTFYSLNFEDVNWNTDVYKPFRDLGIELIESK